MKIIDGIIKEPLGGAHKNPQETAENIKKVIKKDLAALKSLSKEKLIDARYAKIRSIGVFKEPQK
jgi:acetyl-CoA carboxylase carboxyl transferase subunit alpha